MAFEAAVSQPAEDVPADQAARKGNGQFGFWADGPGPSGASAVRAVGQAGDQFEGALEGVEAVEAVVADVQGLAALLASVLLDVEDQGEKGGIFGPRGTHGYLSLLGSFLPILFPQRSLV